jgi:hypothetical protein
MPCTFSRGGAMKARLDRKREVKLGSGFYVNW